MIFGGQAQARLVFASHRRALGVLVLATSVTMAVVALWPTLMCLWEEEGVTQRDTARKSKVENSTTTRTLDKLENLG